MEIRDTTKIKLIITEAVILFIFSFILWEYFHGGVTGHNILQQKELPEISNWWSVIFLPVLTWILLGRIEKRLRTKTPKEYHKDNQIRKILGLFLTGLFLGLVLAVSFTNDYTLFLDNVLYIILVLSFIFPIYYSEFILGFILGMTITFGAILPTVFLLILAAIGFFIFRFLRPGILKLIKTIGKKQAKNPNP